MSGLKTIAATIINGMKPQTIGRALGIGVRVAGRIAGQRLMNPAQPASTQSVAGTAVPGQAASTLRAAAQVPARARRGVAQGVGGFLRPFRRVGGILWLEVTGVFFLLPVVVFGPKLWGYWAKFADGSDRRSFPLTVGVVLVFLYLGVSSFWRARRK